jgi:predicted nucleic acid-binding protein
VIVLDTGGLLAAIDADQRHHTSTLEALASDDGPLRLSPFVLAELVGRDGDLRLGLADASVVVIAGAAKTTRLLTLDERHFRSVRPLWGEAFTLLPADQL